MSVSDGTCAGTCRDCVKTSRAQAGYLRQKVAKKRSLRVVNEHFERAFNTVKTKRSSFYTVSARLRKTLFDDKAAGVGLWVYSRTTTYR